MCTFDPLSASTVDLPQLASTIRVSLSHHRFIFALKTFSFQSLSLQLQLIIYSTMCLINHYYVIYNSIHRISSWMHHINTSITKVTRNRQSTGPWYNPIRKKIRVSSYHSNLCFISIIHAFYFPNGSHQYTTSLQASLKDFPQNFAIDLLKINENHM